MAQEGVCKTPKESQKTANIPITIMEKKLPIIHSKIMAAIRRTGPVKKNIPLCGQRCQFLSSWKGRCR